MAKEPEFNIKAKNLIATENITGGTISAPIGTFENINQTLSTLTNEVAALKEQLSLQYTRRESIFNETSNFQTGIAYTLKRPITDFTFISIQFRFSTRQGWDCKLLQTTTAKWFTTSRLVFSDDTDYATMWFSADSTYAFTPDKFRLIASSGKISRILIYGIY